MTLLEKIAKACAVCRTHTVKDVQKAVESGTIKQFYRGDTVVFVTVNEYPQRKLCELFLIAGDFEVAWDIVDEEIVPWSKALGCDGLLGRGRMGWGKSAKERGWKVGTVAMLDFEEMA